jgi:hypothetical protein
MVKQARLDFLKANYYAPHRAPVFASPSCIHDFPPRVCLSPPPDPVLPPFGTPPLESSLPQGPFHSLDEEDFNQTDVTLARESVPRDLPGRTPNSEIRLWNATPPELASIGLSGLSAPPI